MRFPLAIPVLALVLLATAGLIVPDGEAAPPRTVEIRSYNIVPGKRDEFHRLVIDESMPLLRRWNVDVVAYGLSSHDTTSYYLIRAFPGLREREQSEAAFYGSAEWRNGPRERILALIESYTTIVMELDSAAIAGLRASMVR
jgi:hypothetical protein